MVVLVVNILHILCETHGTGQSLASSLLLLLLTTISQLLNLFIGTLRICNFILLLIVLVRSFSKMLPSMKFAEDKVLVFVILREKF